MMLTMILLAWMGAIGIISYYWFAILLIIAVAVWLMEERIEDKRSKYFAYLTSSLMFNSFKKSMAAKKGHKKAKSMHRGGKN